jgi:hypothetical protein
VGETSAAANTTAMVFAAALTCFKELSRKASHGPGGKGNLTPAEAADRRKALEILRAPDPTTGRRPTFRALANLTGVSSTTLHAIATNPTRRWTPCTA